MTHQATELTIWWLLIDLRDSTKNLEVREMAIHHLEQITKVTGNWAHRRAVNWYNYLNNPL